MVTYFNKKDLVNFGKYLLSEERRELFKQMSEELLEERLKMVHDADVENFLSRQKKEATITISISDLDSAQRVDRNNINNSSF